jgi:hypothetical protein
MERTKLGKTIKCSFSLLIIALLLIQCQRGTEKKYFVKTVAPDSIYSKDSTILLAISKHIMKLNIGAFGGESYNEDKQLYLDSILYSPDLNKIVFWLITKDYTTHLTDVKMPDMLFCYNGHILYAFRRSIKDTLMVSEDSFYATVFNSSYKQAHDNLFEECFIYKRLSNIRSNPESAYNYDDIRSWQESTWDESYKEPHWYLSDTAVVKIENYVLIDGEWIRK